MFERHVTLRDGGKVLIRRLVPEDVALYPDFLSEVTADDLRLRFFAPMREVSHELIEKLIHYDPAHAMAFIAIEEATGKMLGVVRLHDVTRPAMPASSPSWCVRGSRATGSAGC